LFVFESSLLWRHSVGTDSRLQKRLISLLLSNATPSVIHDNFYQRGPSVQGLGTF